MQGRSAEGADRRIADVARRMGHDVPGWLLDHQEHGLPGLEEALAWPAPGFRRGWAWSLPVRRHMSVLLAEHAPGGTALDRLARNRSVRGRILGRPGRGGGHYRLELWFARTGS